MSERERQAGAYTTVPSQIGGGTTAGGPTGQTLHGSQLEEVQAAAEEGFRGVSGQAETRSGPSEESVQAAFENQVRLLEIQTDPALREVAARLRASGLPPVAQG